MFSFLNKLIDKGISINELQIGQINLIDIREPEEVALGMIQTAVSIPMNRLLENPSQYMNKEDTYYLMCQSGRRSLRTVQMLKKMGYQVVNVGGGFGSYSGQRKTLK